MSETTQATKTIAITLRRLEPQICQKRVEVPVDMTDQEIDQLVATLTRALPGADYGYDSSRKREQEPGQWQATTDREPNGYISWSRLEVFRKSDGTIDYRNARAARDEAMLAPLRADVFQAMAASENTIITKVVVSFSGDGDDGGIDEIDCFDSDGAVEAKEVDKAAEAYFDEFRDRFGFGFDNEGCSGSMTFELADRSIVCEIGDYQFHDDRYDTVIDKDIR